MAVDDVTLDIAAGEFFALLGPSGCGKTTTLRMIAGLIEPTSGRIRFDDQDVTWLPPRRRNIGFVFQQYNLLPALTVIVHIWRTTHAPGSRASDTHRASSTASAKPRLLATLIDPRLLAAAAAAIAVPLLCFNPLFNLDGLTRHVHSIVDAAGVQKVFIAADGARKNAVESSMKKAFTAAVLKASTMDILEKMKTDQALAAKVTLEIPSLGVKVPFDGEIRLK